LFLGGVIALSDSSIIYYSANYISTQHQYQGKQVRNDYDSSTSTSTSSNSFASSFASSSCPSTSVIIPYSSDGSCFQFDSSEKSYASVSEIFEQHPTSFSKKIQGNEFAFVLTSTRFTSWTELPVNESSSLDRTFLFLLGDEWGHIFVLSLLFQFDSQPSLYLYYMGLLIYLYFIFSKDKHLFLPHFVILIMDIFLLVRSLEILRLINY
jgi:hypothetical protein